MVRRLLMSLIVAGALGAGFAAAVDVTPTTSQAREADFLNMQVQLSGLWVDYSGEEQVDIGIHNELYLR